MKIISMINQVGNGMRLLIATLIGIFIAVLLNDTRQPSVHWMSAWLAFSFTHLFFSWVTLFTCNAGEIRKIAKKVDASRATLSLFVLLAACVSLIAILLLYVSAGEKSGIALLTHVTMTLLSVAAAWTIVHTTFAFKYAHIYYGDGGLDFPGGGQPGYLDFVYFSFVIGTTFQVSDVSITSTRLRRTAWIHGLLSFVFNTVILSLSINIISNSIPK